MKVELNHTIVHVRDRDSAAREVAETLGVGEPTPYGPFMEVRLTNGVSLDFMQESGEIHGQHYAFLVSDEDFDAVHQRLRDRGRQWWPTRSGAVPGRSTPTTVAAGSTGRAPTDTGWRSSPCRTAAEPG